MPGIPVTVHRNWYRPTISHNTVCVDRIVQGEAAGEAELFLDTPELAAVRTSARLLCLLQRDGEVTTLGSAQGLR